MIASKVLKERELTAILEEKGYRPVSTPINTGTIWQHKDTNLAIQVPVSIDGFYPDWLLQHIEKALDFQFPR